MFTPSECHEIVKSTLIGLTEEYYNSNLVSINVTDVFELHTQDKASGEHLC